MSSDLTAAGDPVDAYQSFIAKSRYARWLEDERRRETWSESVDRYLSFMVGHLDKKHGYTPERDLLEQIRDAILDRQVMPSMRALMTAGEALERSNAAGYNCAYLPLLDQRTFSELLFILMNGTGVGYSVERQYIDQLAAVPETMTSVSDDVTICVADSKEGWADGFDQLLSYLWRGQIPGWDLSAIRPAGARLKTFGGRASGPEPLDDLFQYTVKLFARTPGRRLRPIDAHDLACKIASVVVVGGVRRSAMIALSDLDDQEMSFAKSGSWWETNPHRALANISAVYHDGTTRDRFDQEWDALVKSGSGERGIFNRSASVRQAENHGMRSADVDYGTNPCSEIILRPFQFCNLSEVVCRGDDTAQTLERKVRLAAILGTWQSTLTEFPYLREEWKANTEEERLLGVSLTGVFGSELTNGLQGSEVLADLLRELRGQVVLANLAEAERVGIRPSAATTCVKPSGTVSQLAGVSSGLHPWHAEYYVRTVRGDKKDPLSRLMVDAGVPVLDDITAPDANHVFHFPIKAPDGAITRRELSAIEHLEMWRLYQQNWCEHKPSVTVSVRPEEWDTVREWVWRHLDELSGAAFLPYADDDHSYVQAPYQACTPELYEMLKEQMPRLNWNDLPFYESLDTTTGSQELACSAAGGCDAVDLPIAA